MTKINDLSDLIEKIYSASVNPAEFKGLAQDIARFMSSHSAVIQCRDTISGDVDLLSITDNFTENALSEYGEHYYKVDEWLNRGAKSVLGKPFKGSDLISFREFERSECYADYGRKLGLYDTIAIVFPTLNGICAIGAHRDKVDKRFDENSMHSFALITNHLRRSIEISQLLNRQNGAGRTLIDKFGSLKDPVIVVDSHMNIKFINSKANEILRKGVLLASSKGKLFAPSEYENKRLIFSLKSIFSQSRMMTENPRMELGNRSQSFQLSFLPVPSMKRLDMANPEYTAIVIESRSDALSSIEGKLTKRFNLTKTESRLGAALCEGLSLKDYADSKNLSIETVRSQVKNIMHKTGTHRQAEFVSLALKAIR